MRESNPRISSSVVAGFLLSETLTAHNPEHINNRVVVSGSDSTSVFSRLIFHFGSAAGGVFPLTLSIIHLLSALSTSICRKLEDGSWLACRTVATVGQRRLGMRLLSLRFRYSTPFALLPSSVFQ